MGAGEDVSDTCVVYAGQYYCSGSCYSVSCAVVALLKSGPAPTLSLSQEAKTVAGSLTSLTLPYGLPVGFNLLPCASSGNQTLPALPVTKSYCD